MLGCLAAACNLEGIGEDPGVAVGAAGDHDGVCTRLIEHAYGRGRIEHVSRADDGHRNGFADPPDAPLIGLTAVELVREAAVYGYCRDPGFLELSGELRSLLLPHPSAAADLGRHIDGTVHGLLAGRHDGSRPFRLIHEGGTLALAHHLGNRAGHVDVDQGKARAQTREHLLGRLAELLGLGPEELDGDHALLGRGVDELPGLVASVVDARDGDHLGISERSAAGARHEAPGPVRDAGHGRHQEGSGYQTLA